jgi:CheY-like chemotaxis protein
MNGTTSVRILLVDANTFMLSCLGDYLTSVGFEIESTRKPEHALKLLDRFAPDLIIMDVDLPGIGGVGFLRAILADDGSLRFPVLIFTERMDSEAFCRETFHVHGYLHKNTFGKPLGDAILSILSQHIGDHSAQESMEVESGKAEVVTAEETAHPTILLAEDDNRLAKLITTALERSGFNVTRVEHGPAVVQHAPTLNPTLILMKQILPGLNGVAVASLLTSVPATMNTPVVIYDTSRRLEADSLRSQLPDGVSLLLSSADPQFLTQSCLKLLDRNQPDLH